MPVTIMSPITSRPRNPGLPMSPGARSMPGARDSVPEQKPAGTASTVKV
jgi:hypothetical protein